MLRVLFYLLPFLIRTSFQTGTHLPKATTFTSADGGFVISMPLRPEYSEIQTHHSEETEDIMHLYLTADDNAGYTVGYNAFQSHPVSEQVRQAVLANNGNPHRPDGKAIHLFRKGEATIAGLKGPQRLTLCWKQPLPVV